MVAKPCDPVNPANYSYQQLSTSDQAAYESYYAGQTKQMPGLPALPNAANPNMALFRQLACGQAQGLVYRPAAPSSTGIPVRSGPGAPGNPGTPGAPGKAALDTVYQLSQEVTAPPLGVGVAPAVDGITGLESYFWLTGYGGLPIDRTARTASGASVEMRATPASYVWDFGDGSGFTTTSLGQPYPAVSDIRHTYDVRSDRSRYGVNGRYQVKVTGSFDVSFRVVVPGVDLPAQNWTSFASLGYEPIRSTAEMSYKVDEVVSVLTG
ncbi:MAG: hypothetical protein NVSMB32_00440 [Actinomycetota bacterium]